MYSLRALCRITHQRSHLAVEADLTLRHVTGAEPRRVPETSKTLAMRFPDSMPTQSYFSRKLLSTSPLVRLDPVENTMRPLRFSSIPADPMLCGPPLSRDRSVRHMAVARWRREECGSQERAAPFWLAPGSEDANACGSHFVAAITSAKPKNIDVHDMKPWDPPHQTEIYAAQYEEISLVLSSPICARVLLMPCPCSGAIPLSRKSAAKTAHREIRARQHRRRLHRRRGDLYNTSGSIRLPLTLRGAALM